MTVNKKINDLLLSKQKTVYGLSKHLGMTPQATNYVVKNQNISEYVNRAQEIANYLGVDLEQILDN